MPGEWKIIKEEKMIKIIILVTIIFSTISSNYLQAELIREYRFSSYDKQYGRKIAEEDFGISNPSVTNIISSSWVVSGFYLLAQTNDIGYDKFHYSFNWDESRVRSTFWFITYIDSITRTNVKTLGGFVYDDAIYPFEANVNVVLNTAALNMGLRFTANDTLNVDTSETRLSEFKSVIKQDDELFAKLEFATTDTVNQYFAFGIGYIETLGSKDAFAEYGIDKTRPICFVATSSRHENKWDFCYSYADEEITELTCHSTVGISEPSTIANLLVSPNPADANTTVTVDLETAGNLTVTLNNLHGQELMEIHNGFTVEGNFIKTFSLKELPIGVYYLKIVHNGNVRVEKVIRQ